MRVTILDVAKEAGVSKSTVSLVINHGPGVNPDTCQRVNEAIEHLGYVPNINARGLIQKRTNNIGVLVISEGAEGTGYDLSRETQVFSQDVISGIPRKLKGTMYGLLQEQVYMDDIGKNLPELLSSHRVDGVLIVGGLFDDDFAERIRKTGVPAVVVGRNYSLFDSVYADVEEGTRIATEYLIQMGHRRLCYVNCPEGFSTNQDRRWGFEATIRANQKKQLEVFHINSRVNSGEGGYQAIREAIASWGMPQGIITANDGIALGVMRYFYESGIRIPQDVSIISYEDSILSAYASPGLCSVDINKEKMGEKACELLLKRMKHREMERVEIVQPVKLVIRDSVQRLM